MESLFCILLLIILYVYFGYPLLLGILKLRSRPPEIDNATPLVTLFIPAYNEQSVIAEKISNSLELDYPKDKLEIIVASDASSDSTAAIVRTYVDRGILFFESDKRGGKNSLINRFIKNATGDIIVFTDANALYEKDAIRKLTRNFASDNVGCVVGRLKYIDKVTSVGKGEGLYFRYESMIKGLESRLGTVVAATGSIYAIRKKLFNQLDLDVANDFAHPIQTAAAGYKVIFEKEAVAYEKATASQSEEFKRRSRIVTRGITAFMRYRKPYRMLRGLWGFCFVSHKLLRWFAPFFLAALLTSNIFLHSGFFLITLVAQVVFYLSAIAGAFTKGKAAKTLTVPYYFCLINLAALQGIIKYFLGGRKVLWETAKTTR
jgi:cellulose synthase/poly-beta-1,6-N-acetylglucosamine synthase-like glycosyltransferase